MTTQSDKDTQNFLDKINQTQTDRDINSFLSRIRHRKFLMAAVTTVAIFSIGFGVGLGVGDNNVKTETVTETITVPGSTVVVEKPVTRNVTPKVCIDALGTADSIHGVQAQAFFSAAAMMEAVAPALGTTSVAVIRQATDKVSAETAKVKVLQAEQTRLFDLYRDQVAKCRAS
jgi:hypothetical protein